MIRHVVAASAALCAVLAFSLPPARAQEVSADEIRAIARDAYIYAYPMVVMEITRRVGTNVAQPTGSRRDTGAMDERLPSKDTRDTLRLASQEAEAAMLRLVGVCRPELFPADQWDTLRRINRVRAV